TTGVNQVADKRNQLGANQPNVTGTSDEQIGPPPNGEYGEEIEDNQRGNKQSDVEQLIRSGAGVKSVLGLDARFDNARVNQPHIVNKEQPDNARVSGAQLKPRQRIIESAKRIASPSAQAM